MPGFSLPGEVFVTPHVHRYDLIASRTSSGWRGPPEVSKPSLCLKQGQLGATSAVQGFIDLVVSVFVDGGSHNLPGHIVLYLVAISIDIFFLISNSRKDGASGQGQPSAQNLFLYFLLEIKLKSCFHCLNQQEKMLLQAHWFWQSFHEKQFPRNVPLPLTPKGGRGLCTIRKYTKQITELLRVLLLLFSTTYLIGTDLVP